MDSGDGPSRQIEPIVSYEKLRAAILISFAA